MMLSDIAILGKCPKLLSDGGACGYRLARNAVFGGLVCTSRRCSQHYRLSLETVSTGLDGEYHLTVVLRETSKPDAMGGPGTGGHR